VFDYINTTWPHSQHIYVNGGVPATGSDYFSVCMQRHLTPEAGVIGNGDIGSALNGAVNGSSGSFPDLVLLDFGVNDDVYPGSLRSFEALVRKLLWHGGGMDGANVPMLLMVSWCARMMMHALSRRCCD
jgi:hypothetical protein